MDFHTDNGGKVTGTKPCLLTPQEQEAMQRRRFQQPKPERHGNRWTLRFMRDAFNKEGKPTRKQVREDLCDGKLSFREAQKVAATILAPLNLGQRTINSGITFRQFVEGTYLVAELPLLVPSSRQRYMGVLNKYLLPAFGEKTMGEMTIGAIQPYFTGFLTSVLAQESREKILTVLSSVMERGIKYGCIQLNPCHAVTLPAAKKGKSQKPHITEAQFNRLVEMIPEPYATMVYVSTLTGLRVSELAGLRWNDIHADSITIDERYCRGDWGAPKSDASNATVPVLPGVIERIHRLKTLSVRVGGGRGGYQTFKVVKTDAPDALVFQSVRKGAPLRDNNVCRRHIKPAAIKLGIPWVNWRCLRTSFATLLKDKGVHVRDAQALMRHSKASTTLDIYMQTPDSAQRTAVNKLESASRMIN